MKYTIPLELIELEEANYHLAVTSVFNHGEEHTWVIDTGASKTVFDRALENCYDPIPMEEGMKVQSAGIGAGQLDTSLGRLRPFTLGTLPVDALMVAVIDLSGINDLYFHATARKICGLIGSDFLLKHKAVIDYSRLEVTFRIRKRNSGSKRE